MSASTAGPVESNFVCVVLKPSKQMMFKIFTMLHHFTDTVTLQHGCVSAVFTPSGWLTVVNNELPPKHHLKFSKFELWVHSHFDKCMVASGHTDLTLDRDLHPQFCLWFDLGNKSTRRWFIV